MYAVLEAPTHPLPQALASIEQKLLFVGLSSIPNVNHADRSEERLMVDTYIYVVSSIEVQVFYVLDDGTYGTARHIVQSGINPMDFFR